MNGCDPPTTLEHMKRLEGEVLDTLVALGQARRDGGGGYAA